jgi:DNA helicase II / ATP-dependent DNA helicase PcrA
MTPSAYQLAIYENVANGTGHTVVNAVAGSGKTTSLLEALKHVPRGKSCLFVAFNKSIAEELKSRAPGHVEVSTLHSYGLKCVSNGVGRLRIDSRRVDHFADKLKDQYDFEARRDLVKTVSLAKSVLASDENSIDAVIDRFEIASASKGREQFIKDALALLLQCANTEDGLMDFDDMIWLPLVLELRQRQYDRVFVDETQDLSPSQIEMVLRAVKPDGRIVAVGDPRQAIYGFRGADESAFENVKTRLNATELPLSVCYRCCKSVIREAQEIVPYIEAAPGAIEGDVLNCDFKSMKIGAQPGDFILSRTNAPLVSLCMYFLKHGRKAFIQGRDIGASLAALVKKSKAKNVDELRAHIEAWRDAECARLSEKRRDTSSVEDRAECIIELSDGASSVADVLENIEELFADSEDSNRIALSTTHKAKGLERDRVWLLRSTYMRKGWDGEEPSSEERNLLYVAITRARKTLYLVTGKK